MKTLSQLANFEQGLKQINFLLTRFNLSSEQFKEEINYLLNSAHLNSAQFTARLLKKCHHLLILELWEEQPLLTNHQQFQTLQRILRILDLNNWLELTAKITDPDYDPYSYQLTRQRATQQLHQLVRFVSVNRFRAREPAPPTRDFPSFNRNIDAVSAGGGAD